MPAAELPEADSCEGSDKPRGRRSKAKAKGKALKRAVSDASAVSSELDMMDSMLFAAPAMPKKADAPADAGGGGSKRH
eukprot:3679786-Lingulodinium_polyedra.AAC.1